jgi:hypothetical protein
VEMDIRKLAEYRAQLGGYRKQTDAEQVLLV